MPLLFECAELRPPYARRLGFPETACGVYGYPSVFFISFLPDVNFLIRDLSNVEMSPNFRKTPRFWTFQNFDPKNSATFSEIFWIEKEKFTFEKNTEQKVYIWMSIKNTAWLGSPADSLAYELSRGGRVRLPDAVHRAPESSII